jgi:hypothetical protein
MSDEHVPGDEQGAVQRERHEDGSPAVPGDGGAPRLPDSDEITSHDDEQGTEETTDQIQDAFE